MTDHIFYFLVADIHDGNLETVKDIANTFIELTKTETGSLAYEWSTTTDGTELHIYERFASSEAALAHLGNVGAHLPSLFELAELRSIDCYGTASDASHMAAPDPEGGGARRCMEAALSDAGYAPSDVDTIRRISFVLDPGMLGRSRITTS